MLPLYFSEIFIDWIFGASQQNGSLWAWRPHHRTLIRVDVERPRVESKVAFDSNFREIES